MPRPRRRSVTRKKSLSLHPETENRIRGILLICAGILLLLSLREQAGVIGQAIDRILTFFFGSKGFLFPSVLILAGILKWCEGEARLHPKQGLGLTICLLSFLGMVHMGAPLEELASKKEELAGILGLLVSLPFVLFLSTTVGYTVLSALIIIGIIIAGEGVWGTLWERIKSLRMPRQKLPSLRRQHPSAIAEELWKEAEEDLDEDEEEETELNIVRPAFAKELVGKNMKAIAKKKAEEVRTKRKETLKMQDTRFEEWTFPSFDLLDSTQSEIVIDDEELKRQAKLIEEKLEEFGLDVAVRDARPGPTVTQFTVEPAEGVKLSKIESFKNDLALTLAAQSLRIEAPIPGKSLVGIEMPNSRRTIVHLREVLESPAFVQSTSSLSLPFGRDVSGEVVISRLDDMPHLLLAGATGSGKSVCMNVFLMSLLFQNAPHELKLILVDPKRVELMPYDGIPHLLHPVITEAEKALQAFRWATAEMGRRLHRCSDAGVRNIDEYNDKQKDEQMKLPRIVIVVDELADLMMRQYRRDTEIMVVRIAQMARASGIHLLISTQRPSVDVITGLIKANIPSRIAFRTVSSVDSRTILDCIGAEDLLGKGDMLSMSALTPNPVRIQGIFVSTKEVERVINAVKIAGGGRITEQIGDEEEDEESPPLPQDRSWPPFAPPPPTASQDRTLPTIATSNTIDLEADDHGGDELLFEAARLVKETGKASASLLQRHLKVGYARAARLLDIMEEKGLVGPVDGARARKVYAENLEKIGV